MIAGAEDHRSKRWSGTVSLQNPPIHANLPPKPSLPRPVTHRCGLTVWCAVNPCQRERQTTLNYWPLRRLHCLMSNHFHLLLEVPDRETLAPLDEAGLLAVLPLLYPFSPVGRCGNLRELLPQSWERGTRMERNESRMVANGIREEGPRRTRWTHEGWLSTIIAISSLFISRHRPSSSSSGSGNPPMERRLRART